MKMLKNSLKLLFIITVLFCWVMYLAMNQAHASEYKKAPPTKPQHKKAKAEKVRKKTVPNFVEMTEADAALQLVCHKGLCKDVWTGKVVATGPDGVFLAYSDTPGNRAKASLLGSHVMFVQPAK
jgi:hypothetical protein